MQLFTESCHHHLCTCTVVQVGAEVAHTLFDEYITKLKEKAAAKAAAKAADSGSDGEVCVLCACVHTVLQSMDLA